MTSNSLNPLNMDTPRDLERDASAFGGLFQQIMNEMKNSSPLWEDLTTKSTKLHACLRATIQAVSAFLDAFQKIADAATSTKGATKDIGTSLTRICLRHKALESKLKIFTSSILDCLIIPLQEKLEEWKKCTAQLDKEHSKEYKKARAELKKRSIDTLRLQKKVRKGNFNNGGLSNSFSGGTLPRSAAPGGLSNMSSSAGGDNFVLSGNRELNRVLEVALRETAEKKQAFEDAEKHAIRTALIEERSRFCLFVSYLKPVVDDEVSMLSELTHVQEAMQQLEKHVADPFALPPASEQVIQDLKGSCDSGTWSFQTPPSSPSSLGSRKSSMCSISSANSSSSGSAHSPTHNVHNRTVLHQPIVYSQPLHHLHNPADPLRYSSVSSGDSGFVSQDVIFIRRSTPPFYDHSRKPGGNQSEGSNTSSTASSNSSTPSSPYPQGSSIPPTTTATWPNLQDSIQFERAACAIMNERPHTISSAYERGGHPRTPLTVYTFQPPPAEGTVNPSPSNVVTPIVENEGQGQHGSIYQSGSEIYGILRGKRESKPPVPKRCSSLERPQEVNNTDSSSVMGPPPPRTKSGKKEQQRKNSATNLMSPPSLPDFNQESPDMIVPQPVYVNMHELNQMASAKLLRQQQQQLQGPVEQRQHMEQLPPPPPELMAHAIKVDGGMEAVHHHQNAKGESGSLASSGYGSQNQIMIGDEGASLVYGGGYYSGHAGTNSTSSGSNSNSSTLTGMTSMTTSSGTTILAASSAQIDQGGSEDSIDLSELESFCNCLDIAVSNGYCTLPRRFTHVGNCPLTRSRPTTRSSSFRPQSLAIRKEEPEDFQFYGYLGRQGSRSSISSGTSEKPLPPVRRNSSISVSSSPARNSTPLSPSTPQHNSIYSNVPLQYQGHGPRNTNGNGYTQNMQGFDSSGETTPHASMEQLPPPPSYLMGQADPRHLSMLATLDPNDPALKRMSVAETIKTLTEKNHQPVSPNMVRRSQSMKQPGDERSPGQGHSPPKGQSPPKSGQGQSPPKGTLQTPPKPGQGPGQSPPNFSNSHKKSNHTPQNASNNHSKDRGSLIQLLSEKLTVTQQQQVGMGYGTHIQQQQPQNYQSPQHIYGHLTHSSHSQNQLPAHIQNSGGQSSPHGGQIVTQPPSIPIYHQVVQIQNSPSASSQSASNSPRQNSRRFSEELLKTTATFVQNRVLGNKTPPPVVTSKEIFVQTLNAKLSQMRVSSPPTDRRGSLPASPVTKTSFASKLVASVASHHGSHHGSHGSHHGSHHHSKGNATGNAAFRVRQWISSKTIPDPTLVRESLMDQIRRGTKLKQTRAVNDRSAPKFNH